MTEVPAEASFMIKGSDLHAQRNTEAQGQVKEPQQTSQRKIPFLGPPGLSQESFLPMDQVTPTTIGQWELLSRSPFTLSMMTA